MMPRWPTRVPESIVPPKGRLEPGLTEALDASWEKVRLPCRVELGVREGGNWNRCWV